MSESRLRGSIRSYSDLMSPQWERQHSAIATKTDTGKKPRWLAADPGMWHHKGRGVCHVRPPLHSRTVPSSQGSVQRQGTAVDPNSFACNTRGHPHPPLTPNTGLPCELAERVKGWDLDCHRAAKWIDTNFREKILKQPTHYLTD